ncbi:MAG: SLBB domain-containing protein [bacterium]|nr:SLBB domain-containing protein [bacterium]
MRIAHPLRGYPGLRIGSILVVSLLFLLLSEVKANAQEMEGLVAQPGIGSEGTSVLPFGHQLLGGGEVQEGAYLEGAALTPPDYRLGPGDVLSINIWGKLNTSYRLQVTPEGKIFIPRVGELFVQNLTISQTQETVSKQVGKYYKDIEVNVLLTGLRPIRVFVLGLVKQPDSYRLSPLDHISTAIKRAGGLEPSGSIRRIQLKRQNSEFGIQNSEVRGRKIRIPHSAFRIQEVDLYRFFFLGELDQNLLLEADDVIYVPPAGPTVTIEGKIKRPGQYELKEEEGLEDLLTMAGGFHPEAYLKKVLISRITLTKKKTAVWVDVTDLKQGSKLEDGDQITIYSYAQLEEFRVSIEGEVQRPGEYDLGEGMRLSDLILMAGGLLAQASKQEAMCIRIRGDESREVIPLDLSRLELEENDLVLNRGDKIIVPPLEQVEDTVLLKGQVEKPGVYTLLKGETLRGVILRTGGITSTATREDIKIEREGDVLSVNLYDLMIEKDPETDLDLLNGDVITVPAAPNTVTVVGEVQTGGTFPYEPARTVSYYLGLAGGFSERANEKRIEITRRDGSTRKVSRETVVDAGETIVVDRLEIKGWRDWLSVLVQSLTLVFMVDTIAK